MRLLAVVLSWNGREDTLACLDSLRGTETICVDNGSTDGSADAVAERFPDVELIRTGVNLGFAAGNNVGIRRALDRGADWVALLNNDAVVAWDFAHALTAAAERHPDAGVLAAKVYVADPADVLWYAGGSFNPLLGYSGRVRGAGRRDDGTFDEELDVEWATGAAMAVSRPALERAGLLDEELFAYMEDVDWCLRIREAGFRVIFVPTARAWHRVSASTGGAASPTSLRYHCRNTLAVSERHAPLPRVATGARRGVVVATHMLQALRQPGRGRAAGAAVRGWRDYRRGRMGRVA
jgi:GT2 family glycosyltransferase